MLSKKKEKKKKMPADATNGKAASRGNSQRKSICQPLSRGGGRRARHPRGFLIKATQTHRTITPCVTLEHANFFIRHLVNQIAKALLWVEAAFVKSYEAIT